MLPPAFLKYALGDSRSAHDQVASRLAVARQQLAVVVDDLHLDAERRAALLQLVSHDRLAVLRERRVSVIEPSEPSGLISVMPQAWTTSTS